MTPAEEILGSLNAPFSASSAAQSVSSWLARWQPNDQLNEIRTFTFIFPLGVKILIYLLQ